MFTTQINLPATDRTQLVDLLNQQLADLTDLSSQTKQAHWNVRGRHFYQHHKLFEELAAVVESHIDDLAERIATLGGYARGTVRDAARSSRLADFPADQGDDQGYVDVLSGRFSRCANEVRLAVIAAEELNDSTTADLLTEISRGLDKSLWFLEAHLRPTRAETDNDTESGNGRDGTTVPESRANAPESDTASASGGETPSTRPRKASARKKSAGSRRS